MVLNFSSEHEKVRARERTGVGEGGREQEKWGREAGGRWREGREREEEGGEAHKSTQRLKNWDQGCAAAT